LRSVGHGREAIEYLAGNDAYAGRGKHPLPGKRVDTLEKRLHSPFTGNSDQK